MLRILLIAFAFLVLWNPAKAYPPHHLAGAAGPCPLTYLSDNDGCLALVSLGHLGLVQDFANYPAMVTYAQQTGQSYANGANTTQLQPWNIVGVGGYAVGPWTPLNGQPGGMGNAWDDAHNGLIPGCAASGSSGAYLVSCSMASTDVTIQAEDFLPTTGTGANQCIFLFINNTTTSHHGKIIDNHFKTGAECVGTSSNTTVNIAAGTEDLDVESNEIDGNCVNIQGLTGASNHIDWNDGRRAISGTFPGSTTFKYNRQHDSCGRPWDIADSPSITYRYNTLVNWCYLCANQTLHGEIYEINAKAGPTCSGTAPIICTPQVYSLVDDRYNLSIPHTGITAGITAAFFMGDGGRIGTEFQQFNVIGNTFFGNPFANPIVSISYTSGTGALVITTTGYTALSPNYNITLAMTGANTAALNGAYLVQSVAGGTTCSPSCTVTVTAPTLLPAPTFVSGTLYGPDFGAVIGETTGPLFDNIAVEANYVDVSGGLKTSGQYECIIQGAGSQASNYTGTTDATGTVIDVTSTPPGPGGSGGYIAPGDTLENGSPTLSVLLPVIGPYGGLSGDGNGAQGNYYLNKTLAANTTYTNFGTLGVVTTWNIPASGGPPHSGGLQNYSMTSGNPITGFLFASTNTSSCN